MMRRSLSASIAAFAFAGSAAVMGLAAQGCGAAEQKVEYPQGDAGGPVQTGGGAQVGVAEPGPPGESSGLTGAARDAYDRGWKAWLSGDLPGAKAAFKEALEKAPSSHAAHFSLGTVMDRLGDNAGAQQEFRAAFSAKSDYEPAICAYALSLARNGSTGEANTFITDKQQKMAKSPRILTCAADVKSLANDSAAAQQAAQDALRIDPDYKDAMVAIARDHYRAHRTELAKYALQAILDGFGDSSPPRDRDNAEAHLLRGLILREQGQRQPAMADFQAAVNKRPDMVEALIQLGAMKLEAGNVGEALPLLEGAVRFGPNNALAHLNLGDAYRLSGRPQDAKKEFDTALSQDSSLAVAHYDLGLLYLFSPNVPGTSADTQVATAIKEFETYRSMRGAKAPPGKDDDVDELLSRAKAKQAEMKNAAATAASASAAPAKGAPPAGPQPVSPQPQPAPAPPPKKK
ncbi:tetratricopeptide repeat protein [Pendulispora albinea]|uniref:Tetratricopeptide repeat protein n=1 Tax=Pendulispora albinea TaxID=2741071 RepID=A0ABZ2LJ53_9BACT